MKTKDIPGYEGIYFVTSNGEIWSHQKEYFVPPLLRWKGEKDQKIKRSKDQKVKGYFRKIKSKRMNQSNTKTGYRTLVLYKNGECKRMFVHRLIAMAFIINKNPLSKTCINHKNGIRHDNRLENLEWVSHSENSKHGYSHNGREVWNKGNYVMYDKVCPQCKKDFTHHKKRTTYCSMRCSGIVNSKKALAIRYLDKEGLLEDKI